MSTSTLEQTNAEQPNVLKPRQIVIYGHSSLVYWWPVWVTGYLMALLTLLQGHNVQFDDAAVLMHPSKSLGVIFTVVFALVILLTNVTVRGIASVTVVITLVAITFAFAFFGVWDNILYYVGSLAMFMNLGFYVFFSTTIFLMWALALFVFDKLEYWTVHPGQLVHHKLFGGGSEVYDTHGMAVSKLRDDVFRHWILGLGSGDLHIATTGARKAEFVIPNVFFVEGKLRRIQEYVAMRPDQDAAQHTTTVGTPA
jgi:hypothetical protein